MVSTRKFTKTAILQFTCSVMLLNFLPNEHSKESPFFLMFGREARIPLNTMFQPQIRYLGKHFIHTSSQKHVSIGCRELAKS